MIDPMDSFRAVKMFEALEAMPQDCCQIVGLVRPHPTADDMIQVADPARPEDWHDLAEATVVGFVPLQSMRPQGNQPRIVRLLLREHLDHPLALAADHPHREAERTREALGAMGATSVLTAGAQYCYYDAQGRYICVPI
jgi:hypothetical protein